MRAALGLVLVSALILAPWPSPAEEGLKPGVLAPRFHLGTLDGKREVDSRDLFKESRATVLVLWDSYCPDCLATVKACQKFADRVEKMGVRVVGINYDSENLAAVRGFLKAGKIHFPNLQDRSGDVVKAYRAQAYDFSFFVVDAEGRVRSVTYDHPPEIEKEMEKAVNQGLGKESPLLPQKDGGTGCEPKS
jgi:peroxiredoxin